MFEIKVIGRFAAAHNLRNFQGKCENLHGHNWVVEVVLGGDRLDDAGMLVDFGAVKKHLAAALDEIDHRYLNELEPFQVASPSSERIAMFIYDRMAPRVTAESEGVARVLRVSAWESENSCATYIP